MAPSKTGRRRSANDAMQFGESRLRHRSTKLSSDDGTVPDEIPQTISGEKFDKFTYVSADNNIYDEECEIVCEGVHEMDDPHYAGGDQGLEPVQSQQSFGAGQQPINDTYIQQAGGPPQQQSHPSAGKYNSHGAPQNQAQFTPQQGQYGGPPGGPPPQAGYGGPPPQGNNYARSGTDKSYHSHHHYPKPQKQSGFDRCMMVLGLAVIMTICLVVCYYCCIGLHEGKDAMNSAIHRDLGGGPTKAQLEEQKREDQKTRAAMCCSQYICPLIWCYTIYELVNLCCTCQCGIWGLCYSDCRGNNSCCRLCQCCWIQCGTWPVNAYYDCGCCSCINGICCYTNAPGCVCNNSKC